MSFKHLFRREINLPNCEIEPKKFQNRKPSTALVMISVAINKPLKICVLPTPCTLYRLFLNAAQSVLEIRKSRR